MLPHYTEMLRNGHDVKRLYPLVARHLSHCTECMRLFEDLMMASLQKPPSKAAPFHQRDLDFLEHPQPLSESVEFALPPLPLDTQPQRLPWHMARDEGWPDDGHLLLFEDTIFQGVSMQVLLFLHKSLDAISGEVFAPYYEVDINADLDLGDQRFTTPVRRGIFTFHPGPLLPHCEWKFRLWVKP